MRCATPSKATAGILRHAETAAVCCTPRALAGARPGPWRSRWNTGSCSTGTASCSSIGYAASEGKLDPNCYDLLASEARLASFLAIAKGDIPARHWFRLGRAVTPVANGAALISWSGSMFEYLMPSLVMRAPAGSLIEQTSRLIVQRQMDYGAALGVPWGVSESAYNARDIEMTYQYSNFGVPGLGLKRGLGANTVVAPYATALAAMVDPHGGGGRIMPGLPPSAPAEPTASMRRWTTPEPGAGGQPRRRSCTPSWRIIRA